MKQIIILLLFLIYPSLAHAYIDPSISALIVQSIVGALAVVSGIFYTFKNKLISIYKKIIKRKNVK
jgi:hypothetical protein